MAKQCLADAASMHKQLASFHEVMFLAQNVISIILPVGVASSMEESHFGDNPLHGIMVIYVVSTDVHYSIQQLGSTL